MAGRDPAAFTAVDLLGWTPTALAAIEQLRGWTETAIEQLELSYLPDEHRVGIPIRDELGDELGLLRYDPTGQQHPKMRGPADVPRCLFPPPELVADTQLDERRTIWLVEGEPDAIRLWSLGIPAIGVPGAQNWRDEWAARFTDRHHWRVVVCFDCDGPGRAGAERVAGQIVNGGGDARLVDLDASRDDGYDLTDWTRSADTPQLRDQAADALRAIAAATELYDPPAAASTNGSGPAGGSQERPWRSVPWSTFRDTAPPAHRWLVNGLLPAGSLCFVAGAPKQGKTWIGISIALALALGRPLAGAHEVPEPRDVLYVALEGSQTGLRTRIGALARGLGVDPDSGELERLHMLYRPRPFDLADLATADWLLQEAAELDAALVVVDVLRAAARFQENAAEDFARIRDHLNPLLAAERTVQLLHHFGKLTETQKERSPGERMAGTGAMYGALDVGFLITRSDNGARDLGVTIEARDFAAPDRLDLKIDGDGNGQHGGFTYADTATLVVDETVKIDLLDTAVEWFDEHPEWLVGDDLGSELGVTGKTITAAIKADAAARKAAGEPPRIVQWDRPARELGPKPNGKAWHPSARPFGSPAMLAEFSESPGPGSQRSLDELGPEFPVPPKGGNRGTGNSGEPVAEDTEP